MASEIGSTYSPTKIFLLTITMTFNSVPVKCLNFWTGLKVVCPVIVKHTNCHLCIGHIIYQYIGVTLKSNVVIFFYEDISSCFVALPKPFVSIVSQDI